MTDETVQSRLGRPGAGIPWLERISGKIGLSLYAATHHRERVLADFESSAGVVLALAESLDEPSGRTRVLVPRFRWMEDNSRYWSPYMIVQHLCIVDRQMLMMIRLLSSRRTSDRVVSTADVKPHPDAGPETIGEYRKIVAAWREDLPPGDRLRASARHLHPWFGHLDARGWLCLAAFHHGTHLRQLQAVLKGAGRS